MDIFREVYNETKRERTVPRSGSATSNKLMFTTDRMTNQQISEKNGTVMSWKMNALYNYEIFQHMSANTQAEYLVGLCNKYDIPVASIADYMFHIDYPVLLNYLKEQNIMDKCEIYKHRGKTKMKQFKADIAAANLNQIHEIEITVQPMSWESFKELPDGDQVKYINRLVAKYNASIENISYYWFGRQKKSLQRFLHGKNLYGMINVRSQKDFDFRKLQEDGKKNQSMSEKQEAESGKLPIPDDKLLFFMKWSKFRNLPDAYIAAYFNYMKDLLHVSTNFIAVNFLGTSDNVIHSLMNKRGMAGAIKDVGIRSKTKNKELQEAALQIRREYLEQYIMPEDDFDYADLIDRTIGGVKEIEKQIANLHSKKNSDAQNIPNDDDLMLMIPWQAFRSLPSEYIAAYINYIRAKYKISIQAITTAVMKTQENAIHALIYNKKMKHMLNTANSFKVLKIDKEAFVAKCEEVQRTNKIPKNINWEELIDRVTGKQSEEFEEAVVATNISANIKEKNNEDCEEAAALVEEPAVTEEVDTAEQEETTEQKETTEEKTAVTVPFTVMKHALEIEWEAQDGLNFDMDFVRRLAYQFEGQHVKVELKVSCI